MQTVFGTGIDHQMGNRRWCAANRRRKSKIENPKSKISRRGATVVLVAVCLMAIVAVVALAIDGGVLFDKRRSVQAAADAAALAAADDLWNNYGINMGLDPSGTGKASALSTAKANGFNSDGVTSTVTVNIPPSSGIASGKAGYAEIIVQANQKRSFSAIFSSGTVPVQARAVTCGNPGNVGVYILDPTDNDCFAVDGYMYVLNNGVINVNSSATGAGQIANTANLTSGGINVVGKLVNNGGIVSYTGGGKLNQGAASVADPLAGVPEPSPSGTNYGNVTYNSSTTIYPGIYGSITIAGANITMAPGEYYIQGGINFKAGPPPPPPPPPAPPPAPTLGTLSGNGVMIYNSSGDHLNFQQAGFVYLTPPTSGPYKGIVLYEPRISTQQIHIESSNPVVLLGTVYSQNGFYDFRPDGSDTWFAIGTYVGYKLEACEGNDQKSKSNGYFIVDPGAGVPTQRPKLIE